MFDFLTLAVLFPETVTSSWLGKLESHLSGLASAQRFPSISYSALGFTLQPPHSWKVSAEMEASEFPKASQGFMALNQEKHVAFVATINCFLNLKSINKLACWGTSYPAHKCFAVNAWLTLTMM